MAEETTQDQSYSGHVLPEWFEGIQRFLVLPLLLIGEFYVNGLLAARGFVAHLDQPDSWSWYGGIGVIIMFLGCGLACAGIALGLSGQCAEAFSRGRIARGAFLFFGVLTFAGIEMYAGLSERSVNLVSTPADNALGQWLGLQLQAATPASIVAAVMLTMATIFYGFALKPPKIEAANVRHERMQREQEEAEHKARLAAIKGRALGARFGGIAAAAKEQISSEKPAEDEATNQDGFGPETGGGSGGQLISIAGGKRGPRNRANSGPVNANLPKNHWLKGQFIKYMLDTYGVTLTDDKALQIVSTRDGSIQHMSGFPGTPYSAPKSQLIKWAKTNYGQETKQVSNE